MANFSHLKSLNVSGTTVVEYPLYQLDGNAILHLASASESNKGYFNALLRKAGRTAQAVKANAVNANTLKQNRDEDRVLYAKHVLKGWSGILDADSTEVPYNEENGEEFLQSLPDWLFDEIRNFASNVRNFIDSPIDVEDKGKK